MSIRTIDRYEVLRVLGQGAMGVVYEALDPRLDRRVAIKTVSTDNLQPAAIRNYENRFLTEARAVARLRHPGIVQVFDSGQSDGLTYLVMEYVDGVNLKQCLSNGVRFRPAGAIRMAIDVLDALAHAHAQKIIHRDIKPENILLDRDGSLKLTDFGIAKVLDAEVDNGTLVGGGTIGTPRYMSPEQVRGWQLDERSDMFSMGVTLYELLTATMPFDGPNQMAIGSQIMHETPPAPSSMVSALPQALDAVVSTAMAKRPQDRFATCEQFRQALSEVLALVDDNASESDRVGEPVQLVTPDTQDAFLRLLARQADTTPSSARPDGTICVGEGRVLSPAPEPTVVTADLSHEPASVVETAPVPPSTHHDATTMVSAPASVSGLRRIGALVLGAAVLLGAGAWWVWRAPPPDAPAPAPAVIADPQQSLSAEESLVPPSATGRAADAGSLPGQPPVGATPPQTAVSVPASAAPPAAARQEGASKRAPKASEPVLTSNEGDGAAKRMEMTLSAPTGPTVPAQAAPVAAPAEPCTGLSFFERESCLWKQCKTETYRHHLQCQRFQNKRSPNSD